MSRKQRTPNAKEAMKSMKELPKPEVGRSGKAQAQSLRRTLTKLEGDDHPSNRVLKGQVKRIVRKLLNTLEKRQEVFQTQDDLAMPVLSSDEERACRMVLRAWEGTAREVESERPQLPAVSLGDLDGPTLQKLLREAE